MKSPLVVTLVLALAIAGTATAQITPERFETVSDTWVGPSGNHPDDAVLKVSKQGNNRNEAVIAFDMDTTLVFDNLDCNFYSTIAGAELVVEIAEATGCSPNGCALRVFRDGSNQPLTQLVRIQNGTSGEVRFDIGDDVASLDAEDLTPVYRIVQQSSGGEVLLYAAESGQGPAIEIENRPIPDSVAVERGSRAVFGEVMSYLEAGDPDSDNQFLLIHGMPSYSVMYRNVIPDLAAVGHVVAPDWIGTGFSSAPSPADFGYGFDTQAAHLAELVRQLGMTRDDRQLIVVIHEVGGLGGFHFATTHQDLVKGIAFYETWIDVCPDAFEASVTNPPPPAGLGVCQKDTLAPFSLFFLWETVIYPSEAFTCAVFTPLLLGRDTVQGLTIRSLSEELIDSYLEPYVLTPDCSLVPGPLSFPRRIPVPVAGKPADSRQLYDDYIDALTTWDVPKLLLAGDPGGGFNLVFPEQIDYTLARYPETDAACIGRAGHFGPEDAPFNFARAVLDWASDRDLLD